MNKEEMGTPAAQGASGEPKTAREYPIRAMIRANTHCPSDCPQPGSIIWVRRKSGREDNRFATYGSYDPQDPDCDWMWGYDELELLPSQEREALPKPSPAEGSPEVTPLAKGPSPSEVPQPGEGVDLEAMRDALLSAPIHLLGESLESFLERYKHWYREIRRAALRRESK